MTPSLTIRNATLLDGRGVDVTVADGRVVAVEGFPGETARAFAARDAACRARGDGPVVAGFGAVIDANGGLLLPGLHDHHVHVAATAAALASVRCGPPEVADEDALTAVLARPGTGWLRGVGYHESVAGDLDRAWLDRVAPARPVRVQHRSGRLWVLNSAALDRLLDSGVPPPPGLDRASGRLFDEDPWLRRVLGSAPPDFAAVGRAMAMAGVTGLTEISPTNDDAVAAHFAAQHRAGALPQRVLLAGSAALGTAPLDPALALGPVKLHLHEAHLPDFDATVATIRAAHARGRAVAVHCVTLTELVWTLAVLREAGAAPGDRIEHAGIAPDEQVGEIAALGLAVVTQPHFIAERGDAYRADVPLDDQPHLYRLRAFRDAGVALAGGSDAPFGSPDPWAAMRAAVSRRTASGATIGAAEALTPEEALDLFLADRQALGRRRAVAVGAPADLCLLTLPWAQARTRLSADLVRATFIAGRIVHQRVDQPPAVRHVRADPAA